MKPSVLILRSAGTNCDEETAYAFERAGAQPHRVHINRLLENPAVLADYQILAVPGGFSYGDDIAAGKILASQITRKLHDDLHRFVEAGKPVIGICNGFQVLVKTDLLPGPIAGASGQTATLANNAGGRFIDRWIHLTGTGGKCVWTAGVDRLDLPIAHGEGRFITISAAATAELRDSGQIALLYAAAADARTAGEAYNPNGSVDDIAGVCDATGLVFGLMPHPERYVDPTQHPAWTSRSPLPEVGQGLRIFENAVRHGS
jgi:phosphoribosylformylglycinamidine synthase I